jgi:hypothetical protein
VPVTIRTTNEYIAASRSRNVQWSGEDLLQRRAPGRGLAAPVVSEASGIAQ